MRLNGERIHSAEFINKASLYINFLHSGCKVRIGSNRSGISYQVLELSHGVSSLRGRVINSFEIYQEGDVSEVSVKMTFKNSEDEFIVKWASKDLVLPKKIFEPELTSTQGKLVYVIPSSPEEGIQYSQIKWLNSIPIHLYFMPYMKHIDSVTESSISGEFDVNSIRIKVSSSLDFLNAINKIFTIPKIDMYFDCKERLFYVNDNYIHLANNIDSILPNLQDGVRSLSESPLRHAISTVYTHNIMRRIVNRSFYMPSMDETPIDFFPSGSTCLEVDHKHYRITLPIISKFGIHCIIGAYMRNHSTDTSFEFLPSGYIVESGILQSLL